MAAKRVIIIGEDYERTLPLLEMLDNMDVRVEFWNVAKGALDTSRIPEDAVYFCRQSPSCASRGHSESVSYVRSLLYWLEVNGCKVINGSRCFEVETSKASQMALLSSLGFNVPRTRLVLGRKQLVAELVMWNTPVIVKPNTGGSGAGIEAFSSGKDAVNKLLLSDTSSLKGEQWVIQEHMNAFSADPTKMRSILRFEMVNGRVLYVMQVRSPVTEFSLCPCDPRFESVLGRIDFRIITDPTSIPCFHRPGAYESFCAKLEKMWASLGALVGSVEVFLPANMSDDWNEREYSFESQAYPMEPVVFDVNFNSNYNKTAEEFAGVSGMQATAEMLLHFSLQSTCAPSPVQLPASYDEPADEDNYL